MDCFVPVLDALSRVPRPVRLEREHPMGFAERQQIIRGGCRVDGPLRAGGCTMTVAEPALHVREPEGIGAARPVIIEPRNASLMRQQYVNAFAKASEEI